MFNWIVKELSATDPRTQDWPFVSNPTLLLLIIGSYLYFVLKWGPDFMKDRKPYKLKSIITFYNIAQVLSCSYLAYKLLVTGWLNDYSLGCQPVDYSFEPRPMEMASLVWWTMILKMSEFAETVFFVLRKKTNQISSLHVYHHISTLSVGWMCTKYTAGGMGTFYILINCIVHVLMYSYYLLALHANLDLQKRLNKWKKYLTMIQMFQFCIMIVHSTQGLAPSCNFNKIVVLTFMPNVFLVFYLFYDFYKRSYRPKTPTV